VSGIAAVGDRHILYVELGIMLKSVSHESLTANVEEIDRARAQEYALLATLLSRSPDSVLLSRLADLRDDASPIGLAHGAVREAALRVNEETAVRSYPIRRIIWRRRYTDARSRGCGKRFKVSISK